VADIVQQGREAHFAPIFFLEFAFVEEEVDHLAHDAENAQRMGKTRVGGVRVNQGSQAQLTEATEALERTGVDQLAFQLAQTDIPVYRVANYFEAEVLGHGALPRQLRVLACTSPNSSSRFQARRAGNFLFVS